MKWAKFLSLLCLAVLLAGCTKSNDRHFEFTSVVEGTTVQIPALTGGEIIALYVDTGQEVAADMVLIQIDTSEIFLQKTELAAAIAELNAQETIAGTKVKKARDDRTYLAQKHDRFKKLYASKSVNQQALDDLKNQLDAAETAFVLAQQQFKTLDAKRRQLLAKNDLICKKIDDATIKSSIDGIITEKYYELGEAVAPMRPVLEIVDLNNVWLKIYLPETMLGEVKIGQEVSIQPDGIEKILSGNVAWINAKSEFSPKNILTPETRTSLVYAARINIKNPDQILKLGMPVAVKF